MHLSEDAIELITQHFETWCPYYTHFTEPQAQYIQLFVMVHLAASQFGYGKAEEIRAISKKMASYFDTHQGAPIPGGR